MPRECAPARCIRTAAAAAVAAEKPKLRLAPCRRRNPSVAVEQIGGQVDDGGNSGSNLLWRESSGKAFFPLLQGALLRLECR